MRFLFFIILSVCSSMSFSQEITPFCDAYDFEINEYLNSQKKLAKNNSLLCFISPFGKYYYNNEGLITKVDRASGVYVDSFYYNYLNLIEKCVSKKFNKVYKIADYTYNKEGKIISIKKEDFSVNNSSKTLYEKMQECNLIFSYDFNGNLEKQTYVSKEDKILYEIKIDNHYDQNNSLISKSYQDSIVYRKEIFDKGKLISAIDLNFVQQNSFFTYYENGEIKEEFTCYSNFSKSEISDCDVCYWVYDSVLHTEKMFQVSIGNTNRSDTVTNINLYDKDLLLRMWYSRDDSDTVKYYYQYQPYVSYYSQSDFKEIIRLDNLKNKFDRYDEFRIDSVPKQNKYCYSVIGDIFIIKSGDWKYYYWNDTLFCAIEKNLNEYFFSQNGLAYLKKYDAPMIDTSLSSRIKLSSKIYSQSNLVKKAFTKIPHFIFVLNGKKSKLKSLRYDYKYEIALTRNELESLDSLCIEDKNFEVVSFLFCPGACRGIDGDYSSNGNKFTSVMKSFLTDPSCRLDFWIYEIKVKSAQTGIIKLPITLIVSK